MRTPNAISLAMEKSRSPPAIRNAGSEIESVRKSSPPVEARRKELAKYVASAVGVFVQTTKLNRANPLFIEIGIPPSDLAPFGVSVVSGRPFGATARTEVRFRTLDERLINWYLASGEWRDRAGSYRGVRVGRGGWRGRSER